MTKDEVIKRLEEKFPNRNWNAVYEKMEAGESIPTTMRMAIEREQQHLNNEQDN